MLLNSHSMITLKRWSPLVEEGTGVFVAHQSLSSATAFADVVFDKKDYIASKYSRVAPLNSLVSIKIQSLGKNADQIS